MSTFSDRKQLPSAPQRLPAHDHRPDCSRHAMHGRNHAFPCRTLLVLLGVSGWILLLGSCARGQPHAKFAIPDYAAHSAKQWSVDGCHSDEFGVYADLAIGNQIQRMRLIKPGSFWMGSLDSYKWHEEDETRHRVILTNPYWMADSECEQQVWINVMGNSPENFGDRREDIPVINVSWDDCQEMLRALTALQKPGVVVRLPTEAEWEYACKAGLDPAFADTSELAMKASAWYDQNMGLKWLYRVKSKRPNNNGLYDMHGGVAEWCSDWYAPYKGEEVIDPQGPSDGDEKVSRGGDWNTSFRFCSSVYRNKNKKEFRDSGDGFRFVIPVSDIVLAQARH